MRRGFLLPKSPNTLSKSTPPAVPQLQVPKPCEDTASPTVSDTSPRSTPVSPAHAVKIPTDFAPISDVVIPNIPPDNTVLGTLGYCEMSQPQELAFTVPSHLRTAMLLFEGMPREIRRVYPTIPNPFTAPSPPVHKIQSTEGAGLGVVASTNIARGQTIIQERPLFLLPVWIPASTVQQAVVALDSVVNLMRPENKDALYALSNAKGSEAPSHLKGIIDTNALAIPTLLPGYPARYSAVGRDTSRINHSCSPNATYSWDLETLTITVRALFPIRAGEQVTISYINATEVYDRRQEELRSKYNFTCKCTACRQEPTARYQADMQRVVVGMFCSEGQLARDAAAFDKWLADGAPAIYSELELHAHMSLQDVRRKLERLDGVSRARAAFACMMAVQVIVDDIWEPVLARLVKAYSVVEDEAHVREYALMAAFLKKAHTGADGGWAEVARNPRKTDWWGRLGAKRVVEKIATPES
ncbi:hypothetical protein C8Q80DRAFT_1267396 [Daedaleopsis nitida]|nr:hypothetical protein C8Q80DRAFT_1267396 [Daedaleopsis nitida]